MGRSPSRQNGKSRPPANTGCFIVSEHGLNNNRDVVMYETLCDTITTVHLEDILERGENENWEVGKFYCLTKNNVPASSPPGVRFERNGMYGVKPEVPNNVDDQQIDDVNPHEHRQRHHRSSSGAGADDESAQYWPPEPTTLIHCPQPEPSSATTIDSVSIWMVTTMTLIAASARATAPFLLV